MPVLTAADARAFAHCIATGGVAVFPADTVYGLACDPENVAAVARLYALKGRAADKPAAVMWFDRAHALGALPRLGPRTRAAAERLLPGPVTLLLPNPDGLFPLAAPGPSGADAAREQRAPCPGGAGAAREERAPGRGASAAARTDGGAPAALGIRVPCLAGPLAALEAVPHPVLQSSANTAGGADPRALADVPTTIRDGADLALDAGPLPGTPSTVIDLRDYEAHARWTIVRAGALAPEAVAQALGIVGRP